jgi:hypothetical protein
MFKKQKIICCICGLEFNSDFNYCGGYVCSPECKDEYEWRKTLYIMGKEYEPRINTKL